VIILRTKSDASRQSMLQKSVLQVSQENTPCVTVWSHSSHIVKSSGMELNGVSRLRQSAHMYLRVEVAFKSAMVVIVFYVVLR